MKNLVKYVQNIRARHMLWNAGDTIVMGVSGGPDSMCLFDVMLNIANKANLKLVVAHVNYGLRGKESKSDQKLVEQYAKKNGTICESLVCLENCGQNEKDWRNMRYDFFAKMTKKYTAECIVVAHTKNDQAETLLLHLLRGSGLNGLSGMRVRSENNIVRPLLTVERRDILAYCDNNEIPYNIDNSNMDTALTRNAIRNNLIPYLAKEFNPQIIDTLANTATIIADDYDFLVQQKDVFWQINTDNNNIIFSADIFLQKKPSQQRLSLRTMIQQMQKTLVDIENGLIEEMRIVIASTKSKHQIISTKNLKMMKKGDTVELDYCKD